jgi:hypothetical protein
VQTAPQLSLTGNIRNSEQFRSALLAPSLPKIRNAYLRIGLDP